MRAGKQVGTVAALCKAPANRVVVRAAPRRTMRERGGVQRAKTGRLAVGLSSILALLPAALLVGGRAIIDALLPAAMPDGAFCRRCRLTIRRRD
jgi:hypothetical protein